MRKTTSHQISHSLLFAGSAPVYIFLKHCNTIGLNDALTFTETSVMVVNPFKQGRTEQQLMTTGDVIQSHHDHTRVVAADGDDPEPGTGVSMCRYVIADVTQKWEFVYK